MTSKVPNVFILGHSGFIGSHLGRALLESGTWEVTGRSLPDIDLTVFNSARQLVPYFTPRTTLVLAAAVKRQFGDTLEAFRQNVAIVENVCRLLETHPVRRVIFFSSAAVYGEETGNTCINEQTPVNPTSFYGIAKYTAERLLKKTSEASQQTSLVCLRPPLVYGAGDKGRSYGPAGFCAAAQEGTSITLWGDGSELREFIYIDDICRLIEVLIGSEFSGELNVASGTRYCFADVVAVLKSRMPDLEVNTRPRNRQKADNAFDACKIKSLLPPNFKFTSLEAGLARILDQS